MNSPILPCSIKVFVIALTILSAPVSPEHQYLRGATLDIDRSRLHRLEIVQSQSTFISPGRIGEFLIYAKK